jgi:hypothetical protein
LVQNPVNPFAGLHSQDCIPREKEDIGNAIIFTHVAAKQKRPYLGVNPSQFPADFPLNQSIESHPIYLSTYVHIVMYPLVI